MVELTVVIHESTDAPDNSIVRAEEFARILLQTAEGELLATVEISVYDDFSRAAIAVDVVSHQGMPVECHTSWRDAPPRP